MAQMMCGKCGKELPVKDQRFVRLSGTDSVVVCPACEPSMHQANQNRAQAAASRPRELHVARCDNLYGAIMETCGPIASRIYLSTCQRQGVIATADGLSQYMMGFVDCAWCMSQGELAMTTWDNRAEAQAPKIVEG